jgi:hypothetical protein
MYYSLIPDATSLCCPVFVIQGIEKEFFSYPAPELSSLLLQ